MPRRTRRGIRVVGALVLLAAVLAGLFWFRGRTPVQSSASFTSRTYPAPVNYSGDPAADTARLLAALNRRLAQKDLLKLLDREVEVEKIRLGAREVATYRETFRLPSRSTPGAMAALLQEAARDAGAQPLRFEQRTANGGKEIHYACAFGFSSEWTPVEVVFVESTEPRVCLIIDDGGYRRGAILEKLYALKVPITLAVIPGLEFSKEIARSAPFSGVEVLCHLPMEGSEAVKPDDYPFFIRRGQKPAQVERMVREAVAAVPVCRGVNNHMGSLATGDPDLMLQVCSVLKSLDLFFVDSKTSQASVAARTAAEVKMPYAERDVFLDNEPDPAYIRRQFKTLLDRARRGGTAVGIGHLHESTLDALAQAIPEAREQGFRFVFASEVVK